MYRTLLANRTLLEMTSKGQNARNKEFTTGFFCIFEIRELLAHLLQLVKNKY